MSDIPKSERSESRLEEDFDCWFIRKERERILDFTQNIGIVYPYRIDNYVKIVKGVKAYARYTDDFHAIHESKEFPEELLEGIRRIAEEYGLITNEKKTRIVRLDKDEMAYEDIENAFKGWMGSNYKRMSRKQITNLFVLYYELFERRPQWQRKHGR